MRVLITGGAGFIAYHVASALLKTQTDVFLLDNFNDFYDPEIKRRNVRDLQSIGHAPLHVMDILDRDKLRHVFEEVQPDVIVHLAAWAGVRPSIEKPELYSAVNITGTIHLLELAKEFGTRCFVFGSSSSVYGGSTRVPFTEEDPVDRPISPYAATKRAGELLCHTYAHNFSMHITEGKEIPIFGKGDTKRDYTYVEDIVSGILAAIEVNPRFEILNLGESQTITLLELVEHLERALGMKAKLRFLPLQTGDVDITYADISRAHQVLGYNPKRPFREGIQLFADWFKNKN
jgi:UDP-glucuronate 4-epimerase